MILEITATAFLPLYVVYFDFLFTLFYASLSVPFPLGFLVTPVWWIDPKVTPSDSCILVFTPLRDPLILSSSGACD